MSDRLPPVSVLPFQRPGLGPTMLERDPHSRIQSQSQLVASLLALLTVHFSYFPVCILILTRTRCFVIAILICGWRICRAQSPLSYSERSPCLRSLSSFRLLKRQRLHEWKFEKTWLPPPCHVVFTPSCSSTNHSAFLENTPSLDKLSLPFREDFYPIYYDGSISNMPHELGKVRENLQE